MYKRFNRGKFSIFSSFESESIMIKRTKIAALMAVLTLCGSMNMVEAASIDLGESVVKSDYVEVNRLKETKEVIVIDKEELEEKNYSDLGEVLKDVSSINVDITGNGDIDIRGQGAGQANRNIQVLIDGAPITILTSHPYSNNYNYIPVQNIEKIEIIPGGGSVMYGSGASGGVINITTNLKKINKPTRTVTLTHSSNENNQSVAVGDKLGDKVTYQLNYTKSDKDLYFKDTYKDTKYLAFGTAITPDPSQRITLRYSNIEDEGQEISQLNWRKIEKYGKDYVPKEVWKTIGLDENGKKIRVKVPGYKNINRDMKTYSLNYVKAFGPNHQVSIDAFKVDGNFNNNSMADEPMDHKTKGIKMKYDITYGVNNDHTLLIGYDHIDQDAKLSYMDYRYDYTNKNYYEKPLHFFYDKTINAYYADNTVNKGKWAFKQGIRFEHVQWGYDKIAAKSSGADTRISNDIAANAGVSYRYNDTGRVYFNAERGFTHPDGIQSADDNGENIIPSPVEDEKFRNYELGWNDKVGISNVSVVGFYSETDNQIDRLFTFSSKGFNRMSRNLYNTKRRGVDVSATQKLGKWKFKESYTYLKGKSDYSDRGREIVEELNKTQYSWNVESLKAVPRNKFVMTAAYAPNDNWEFTASYNFLGKYQNFAEEKKGQDRDIVPCRQLVDFDIAYRRNKDFTVHAGVKNMFDKKYANYKSEGTGAYYSISPGDERSYYTSVTYKF